MRQPLRSPSCNRIPSIKKCGLHCLTDSVVETARTFEREANMIPSRFYTMPTVYFHLLSAMDVIIIACIFLNNPSTNFTYDIFTSKCTGDMVTTGVGGSPKPLICCLIVGIHHYFQLRSSRGSPESSNCTQ